MVTRAAGTNLDLVERARSGDRLAVARLVSIVEDGGPELAEVAAAVFPHTGRAYAVGITGAPGAGKSTLTDALIGAIRAEGHRVGVLAVDPSSPFTGGALLGDRVRMQAHATDDQVFIRSMATRGHLGGLALATPQAIRVLDAAGNAYILVETVGVGQAEVDVARTADTTVVIVTPGWGDSVQAGKAGLLEVADVFVVNKADRQGAPGTVRELEQMLHLGPPRSWQPPVLQTVATRGEGVAELWAAIGAHRSHLAETGELEARRRARLSEEISTIVAERVKARVRRHSAALLDRLLEGVERRELSPYAAAAALLDGLGGEGA
ncbi:MAG TPA: methylmalonyl Co-A mutase-associated GTPase MeaB [Actinomycetota bacterium]|jgi:LAO/AO transport system kinase